MQKGQINYLKKKSYVFDRTQENVFIIENMDNVKRTIFIYDLITQNNFYCVLCSRFFLKSALSTLKSFKNFVFLQLWHFLEIYPTLGYR